MRNVVDGMLMDGFLADGQFGFAKGDAMTTSGVIAQYEQVEAALRQERAILAKLLEQYLRSDGHIFVTRLQMGRTTSYVGSASMRWVGNNIKLASQMPLLRNKVDLDTNRIVIDQDSINELQQREPDWSRQPTLVHYLVKSQARKFPPILVVVGERWVSEPDAEEWGPDKRALRSSISFEALDSVGQVGLVDFRRVDAYAADGQHRLIGITGVLELSRWGRISLKTREGKDTGQYEELADLAHDYGITEADIQRIEHETIGVELIPAVMEGETREEARRRVRSIFVHVNKTARRLTQGELALLDEDNGFAIVARRLALGFKFFGQKKAGDRVNMKTTALPAGGKWLTALATLQDMSRVYLSQTLPFGKWLPSRRDEVPLRPEEEHLDDGFDRMEELWRHMTHLPSFAEIDQGAAIDEWREFPSSARPNARGHLLMRPLGQLILAEAVGYLHLNSAGPRMELDNIFAKLDQFDADGGFEAVSARSPWFAVTYDPVRERMLMAGRDTAVQMLEYLLTGDCSDGVDNLREQFRKLRTITPTAGKELYFNHDGSQVETRDEIQLPPVI